jgi:hypothetical protein
MRRLLSVTVIALPALSLVLAIGLGSPSRSAAEGKAELQLAHMVFFTLKEHAPAARAKLAASCRKYLAGIEGVVYFSVGTAADDSDEPGVSVHDFDVALHTVFTSKDAKNAYLKHSDHVKFVEENRDSFAKVRVFDSYLVKQ